MAAILSPVTWYISQLTPSELTAIHTALAGLRMARHQKLVGESLRSYCGPPRLGVCVTASGRATATRQRGSSRELQCQWTAAT